MGFLAAVQRLAADSITLKRSCLSREDGVLYFLKRPKKRVKFSRIEVVILLFLFVCGVLLRFVQMDWPPYPLFDESFFGHFINSYMRRVFFFDVHPPFSRLLLTALAVLAGYDGNLTFVFRSESGPTGGAHSLVQYHESAVYYQLRTVPALFSSSVAPLLFILLRLSGVGVLCSSVGGVLALTDTVVLIQGRLLLTDGLLHFFFVCCMAVCKFALRLQTHSAKWRCSLVLAALLFAFAVNTKFTAGGAAVVILVSFALDIMRTGSIVEWRNLVMLLLFALLPVAVYAMGMYVHAVRGVYHSADSRMLPELMTRAMRETVGEPVNMTAWMADKMLYWRFRQLLWFPFTYIMDSSDMKSSRFYQWPLLNAPWFSLEDKDKVYACAGQPFLWPVGFGVVVLATLGIVGRFLLGTLTEEVAEVGTFVGGYWASLLPFVLVKRTTYLYHYTLPSIMVICAAVSFINAVLPPFWAGFVASGWVVLSVGGLVLFAPLVYGAPQKDARQLCWTKQWC
jgi:dolichyl-phosphate-mannose--protein O-mannosyl transferase